MDKITDEQSKWLQTLLNAKTKGNETLKALKKHDIWVSSGKRDGCGYDLGDHREEIIRIVESSLKSAEEELFNLLKDE